MPETRQKQLPFEWLGEHLALDFVNTVSWDGEVEYDEERLHSYPDLVGWAREAGLLDERAAARLLRTATRRPQEAAHALQDALELRRVLLRIFSRAADGGSPAPADSALFNAFLGRALGRLQIDFGPSPRGWRWTGSEADLDRMLWPIVWAAAELLTSETAGKLRVCAGERCGWLFLDLSRNRTRRWCDMGACGNKAKARRHYARARATSLNRLLKNEAAVTLSTS